MTTVNNATYGSQSISDGLKLNQDFDQFLRLLTTQLQNQDPLSPMDSNEFTNQLVQFSNVEQQIKTNTNLENLLGLQTLNLTALGVSFIGKSVEVSGKTFQADGVTPVTLSYSLPGTPNTGTISILDENGNSVYSREIEKTAGLHTFTWDGKNSNGNSVASGKYEIRVSALTETNGSLNVSTYVPGYVNGLESSEDGTLVLNVGELQVPITDVRKIFQTAAPTPAPAG
jgi:flagellar basal-body rod modification protein FlgD